MKSRKITFLLAFSLLTISLITMPMQTPSMLKKAKRKVAAWTAAIGNILTEKQPVGNTQAQLTIPNDPFPFGNLPKDAQRQIIFFLGLYGSARTLSAAAEIISNLAQTNKFLNELINEPKFCLHLIKSLAQRFNCSDFVVSKTLPTERAKIQHNLQESLFHLCTNKDRLSPESLEMNLVRLINQGVDVNYTYLEEQNPALIIATYATPSFASYLLDAPGIDPELANKDGLTALDAAEEEPKQNKELITRIQQAIREKHLSSKK